MLAPKAIIDQIKRLMGEFLWNGGRGNNKRIHLVNWEMVKRPLVEGGLQIRESTHANIAMGCKILWQLHTEPNHSISQIIKLKYINNQSLKHFSTEKTPKDSLAWTLCSRGIEFFRTFLYRIPGNGRNTKLWSDKIMGHPPLAEVKEMDEIIAWLIEKGIWKLEDISDWDNNGNWQCWKFPRIPYCMKLQFETLIEAITDFALVHKDENDSWGWGIFGAYSAAQGYFQMQSRKDSIHPAS